MLHTAITCLLVHCSIGSMIWVVLDGLGIIDNTFSKRNAGARKAMVTATIFMIVGWPVFIGRWLWGMCTT
jgi:hypothetical protein